jgi:hypothetical protein
MANLTEYFPAAAGSNVLEEIQCVPDGRNVTVGSGTYTLQNTTGRQQLTSSYAELTGSKINYTPPSGAKYIKYQYQFHINPTSYFGISHYRIYVGNDEVTNAYKSYSHQQWSTYYYGNQTFIMNYVFDLTASSTNAASGQFHDWTDARDITVKARNYSSTYNTNINGNKWRDGTSASGSYIWTRPLLTIQALS